MPIRHNIPGARKRRDHKHGPRKPTGWVRTEFAWVHPDGRRFYRCFGGGWLSKRRLYYEGTDNAHPGKFSERMPF